jgi:hypothetical protein
MAGVNKDGVKLVGMLVAAFAIGDYSRCFQLLQAAKNLMI